VLFGAGLANVVQAAVFTFAHLGITYTSSTALFLVVAVLPLGLLAGYLMRTTNSIVVPCIVHAALDVPIYLVYLSSVP
jgi:membrane protease YdiL (CAAX protease family)